MPAPKPSSEPRRRQAAISLPAASRIRRVPRRPVELEAFRETRRPVRQKWTAKIGIGSDWCAVPKEFWTGEACGQRPFGIDKFKAGAGDRRLHRSQLRVDTAIPKEPTKPRWPALEAISVVVGLFAAAATAASLVYVAGAIRVGSWGGGAFLSVMTFIVALAHALV